MYRRDLRNGQLLRRGVFRWEGLLVLLVLYRLFRVSLCGMHCGPPPAQTHPPWAHTTSGFSGVGGFKREASQAGRLSVLELTCLLRGWCVAAASHVSEEHEESA